MQSDTLVQVSLIDEHGTLVANTAEPQSEAASTSPTASTSRCTRIRTTTCSTSASPVLGRVSGLWTLQITRRLNHPDGSFAGVVVVSEDPSYFTSDFYNVASIGREGVIAVVSDNGSVLARNTGAGASEGSAGGRQPRQADAQRRRTARGDFTASGVYPTSDHASGIYVDPIDNVTRIVSYRHIDGYPLGVLVGLSRSEEFVDYNHTRNVYLLMATFISLAMLGFFARRDRA